MDAMAANMSVWRQLHGGHHSLHANASKGTHGGHQLLDAKKAAASKRELSAQSARIEELERQNMQLSQRVAELVAAEDQKDRTTRKSKGKEEPHVNASRGIHGGHVGGHHMPHADASTRGLDDLNASIGRAVNHRPRAHLVTEDAACVPSVWSSNSYSQPAAKMCLKFLQQGGSMPSMGALYNNTALWHDPSEPLPHINAVLLRPLRKGVNAPSNKTSLIVYAMCASSAYALDIHRINLGGMRLHHPESTIVMATCGEHSLPEDIFDMPDAVLQARCASSRGYD